MSTGKTDQTGQMPGQIFAGRTHHFVGFVMRRLICEIFNFYNSVVVPCSSNGPKSSWKQLRVKLIP